ncbi:hypothetical protein FX988_02515 [Paraglaciecola mesophila]|uniref:Uncharacterized protein n=1 Tax=Paraglaciecola mesophila TaxID=197222 RepID=A0A857JNX7_9ALTE|nr:hypothetical protein [Paraglaciecola mesophila]QHJ12264.1 hypothetical protein FX988_02515 [Paraglaciecola mesophila]
MQQALTYLGTLDDVVQRYPWNIEIGLQQFNQMLIRKALLGEKIIINDGYLLNHPFARQALLNPTSSPLKALIEANFVQVMSRSGSLLDVAEKMAAQGVESFQALQKSAEWPDLQRMLKQWEPGLQRIENFIPWPKKHISHGFDNMLGRSRHLQVETLGMAAVSNDDFQRVFDLYTAKNKTDKEATRTRWEQACLSILGDAPDAKAKINELMGLATEAYHYNFAVCLSSQFSERKILVETRYSRAFADLIQLGQPTESELVDIPSIQIPQKLSFDRPQLWKELVDPFSDVAAVQKEYQDVMDQFFAGQANAKLVEEVSLKYSKALSAHFENDEQDGGIKKVALSIGFLGLGLVAGGPVTAGLLWLAENSLLPTVTRVFKLRDKGFFKKQSTAQPMDLSRKNTLSSVSISLPLAEKLAKDIPDFN